MATVYNKSEIVFAKHSKDPRFIDRTGTKFGRLTVIGFAGRNKKNNQWFCKCECGNITKVDGGGLTNRNTISCGCLHKERASESNITHGHNRIGQSSRTYITWSSMIARCQNLKDKNYGGRGITVCKRWRKFENFLKDMGERPENKTLDRKENNKGYYKKNCRWATPIEQANNQRSNILLTYEGRTQTLTQWAKEIGIRPMTMRYRIINAGWSVKKAITTPLRVRNMVKISI